MPAASTIGDLLKIRAENRQLFADIPNRGTALGFENGDGPPAVIVFVERKIHKKWLAAGSEFPDKLHGPGKLKCPLDVIGVGDLEELPWPAPVSGLNLGLLDDLRGAADRLQPGSQLAAFGLEGDAWWGTLAAFARDRTTKALGLITNQHVGGYLGNVLKAPDIDSRPIAVVKRQREYVSDEVRYGNALNEKNAYYKVDCAFAELFCDLDTTNDLDPRITIVTWKKGRGKKLKEHKEQRTLGPPMRIDLKSMDPIGQPVIGVGRTRGSQRGTVRAVAYEVSQAWTENPSKERDEPGRWVQELEYTDLVIQGRDGDQFSDSGDSGKLIVTDEDNPRPIGLLWGGAQTRFRQERQTEDWSLAVGIGPVLDELGVEIVSKL